MTATTPENTTEHVARLPSGRWAPGRSGNAGGRPKVVGEVRDLARAHTQLAIDTLAEIAAHGVSEMARIAAANSLLDRGWGKPAASLELRDPDFESVIELIAEEERHTRELLATPLLIMDKKDDPDPKLHSAPRLNMLGARSR
jgi:hypothetical protein